MSTFDRIVAALDYPGIDVDLSKVTPAANLRENLSFDSLDEVALELALEEEFAIAIETGASDRWKTIADVVSFVDDARTAINGAPR